MRLYLILSREYLKHFRTLLILLISFLTVLASNSTSFAGGHAQLFDLGQSFTLNDQSSINPVTIHFDSFSIVNQVYLSKNGGSPKGIYSDAKPCSYSPNYLPMPANFGDNTAAGTYELSVGNSCGTDMIHWSIDWQYKQATLKVEKTGAGTVSTPKYSCGAFPNTCSVKCGPTCSVAFDNIHTVLLTATPADGYYFDGWTGACIGNAKCKLRMDGDKKITANFVKSAPPPPPTINGACGSANGKTFDSTDPLYMPPDTCSAGNQIGGYGGDLWGPWTWSCEGKNGGSTASCSAATTHPIKYFLRLSYPGTAAGTGKITTTSNPIGVPCNSGDLPIGFFYLPNTNVTLTASSSTGYVFMGWSGACSGSGNCILTMDEAKSVSATFAPLVLTVSKLGTGNGTITSITPPSPLMNCDSTCSISYIQGTWVTLKATPNPGNIFTGWSGACTGKGTCSVTMNTPQTVNANFVPDITPIIMMLLDD